MNSEPTPIEAPKLILKHSSIEEYCKRLQKMKHLSYWWYQGVSSVFGNYSIPFQDENGNWWYQVKPGLCWPVDAFRAIAPDKACPPFNKSYLGYQHIVPKDCESNSHLVLNTIFDLSNYGPSKLKDKRRNKVRNGIKFCELSLLESFDKVTFDECRAAWDSLSQRTGWKQAAKEKTFDDEWRILIDCPGVSIIVARERSSGKIAGFMIVKIIGDTAYSDTVAARTDMLHTHVNDALRYSFLANAMKIKDVTKGYSAIRSTLEGLETFKMGIGYEPYSFPAYTHLCPGVGLALKYLFRSKYDRMMGRFET
jgi:hypothetical protein